MTSIEKKLLLRMIDVAIVKLDDISFDDTETSLFRNWTLEQRQQFVKDFYVANNNLENYIEDSLYLPDWAVLWLLAKKLEKAEVVLPKTHSFTKESLH